VSIILRSKRNQQLATSELLEILAQNPSGFTTSELSGTPKFHGHRTLNNRQIIRLLRESGQADEFTVGHGIRTATLWRFKRSTGGPT